MLPFLGFVAGSGVSGWYGRGALTCETGHKFPGGAAILLQGAAPGMGAPALHVLGRPWLTWSFPFRF